MIKHIYLLPLLFLVFLTTCKNPFFPKAYEIGDKGPAGGRIFYDKERFSDGWRYMEAAPEDIVQIYANWSWTDGDYLATSTGIGTGKNNTKKIVAYQENYGYYFGSAAQYCNDYIFAGYKDWFLPSLDELKLMYYNLHTKGLGEFIAGDYWSSSEEDGISACCLTIFSNTQTTCNKTDNSRNIRPVRRF